MIDLCRNILGEDVGSTTDRGHGRALIATPPENQLGCVWLLNNVRMCICKILPTSGKVQYVHSAAWSSDSRRY